MQCTQYVREYFPMMFALLKQEVVSGVHTYVSVTTYVRIKMDCVMLIEPLGLHLHGIWQMAVRYCPE